MVNRKEKLFLNTAIWIGNKHKPKIVTNKKSYRSRIWWTNETEWMNTQKAGMCDALKVDESKNMCTSYLLDEVTE